MNRVQVLEREVAKLYASRKGIGGIVDTLSGARLHRWVLRHLRTEAHAEEYALPYGVRQAVSIAANALARVGHLQDGSDIDSANPMVVAIAGSGHMNLNPCVIVVEVIPQHDEQTVLAIMGGAKEGLINQHTAVKAIERVMDAIRAEAEE
jgi:hypothetical protein